MVTVPSSVTSSLPSSASRPLILAKSKKYKQTWTDNMSKMGKAKITTAKAMTTPKSPSSPTLRNSAWMALTMTSRPLSSVESTTWLEPAKVAVKLNGTRIPVVTSRNTWKCTPRLSRRSAATRRANDKSEIITAALTLAGRLVLPFLMVRSSKFPSSTPLRLPLAVPMSTTLPTKSVIDLLKL